MFFQYRTIPDLGIFAGPDPNWQTANLPFRQIWLTACRIGTRSYRHVQLDYILTALRLVAHSFPISMDTAADFS